MTDEDSTGGVTPEDADPIGAAQFGPIDPRLGAWLASVPSPAMPEEVWARLQAALASEPPLAADSTVAEQAAVGDLHQARQRKSVAARTWPILGAAAGVVLIGVIALPVIRGGGASPDPVTAGGAVTTSESVERRTDAPSSSGAPAPVVAAPKPTPEAATPRSSAAESAPLTASAPAPVTAMPAALKATGTNYTPAQIDEQARALLASAGFDQPVDVTQFDPSTAPLPDPLGEGGFTASAEQLLDCLQRLGVDGQTMPLVVDRATYDGHDAGVVVLAHATGADPALDVVVVEAACTDDDIANAMHYALALAN